ncbi:MAG TPA: hypothetical protein VEL07_03670 [Planctomycetota bacterium]|nr:hypothetical protein [Planctomycetota bacterium]
MNVMRVGILLLAACVLAGAEHLPGLPNGREPVDVPDPIGLGERLAVIDWLREAKVAFPEDATIEQLRVAYLRAAKPELFQAEVDAAAEAALTLEARQQVAGELWGRHRVAAKPEQSVADLEAMLRALDAKQAGEIARLADESRDPADPIERAKARFGVVESDPARRRAEAEAATCPGAAGAGAPAPAVAGGPPPLDEAHAGRWSNYDTPAQQAKDDIEIRVYCLVGDRTSFYVWANNRTAYPRLVRCSIAGQDCALYIARGKANAPAKVTAASWSADPALQIIGIDDDWTALPAGTIRIQ